MKKIALFAALAIGVLGIVSESRIAERQNFAGLSRPGDIPTPPCWPDPTCSSRTK